MPGLVQRVARLVFLQIEKDQRLDPAIDQELLVARCRLTLRNVIGLTGNCPRETTMGNIPRVGSRRGEQAGC